jgi:large subunit ribosomal protein L25
MADFVTIEAEARARSGKGAARAVRRSGKVPGVLYGAKQAPTLIALEPRAVLKELHQGGWRSRLFEVSLAGERHRALIRDVQFHPVTDTPEHVDFQRLAPGEKIRVAVAVRFLNDLASPGLKRGGVLNVVRHSVDVLVDPENAPNHFDADLTGLEINDNIRWHNLTGTEDCIPSVHRDFVIATVASGSKMTEAAVDPAAPAAAAAAPAKGKAAAPAKAAAAPAKGAAPAKAAAAPAKPAAKKK